MQLQLPSRRSSRVANIPAVVAYSADNLALADHEEEEESEEEEEGELDDSDVIKYIMSCKKKEKEVADCSKFDSSINNKITDERMRKDVVPSSINLCRDDPIGCDDLPAIYSMCFHPDHSGMILAAGKGGNVTFFRTPFNEGKNENKNKKKDNGDNGNGEEEDKEDEIIHSFRAHSRWASTAKFVQPGLINGKSTSAENHNNNSLPIITASDDATIKLWDAAKSYTSKKSGKLPHLFWSSTKCHDRGVFSLDICGSWVLSGSKDKTVCVSQIQSSGAPLTPLHRFCLHSKVVKSVDWKKEEYGANASTTQPIIYASGGQDGLVCVKDIRVGGKNIDTADVEIENCHDGGVHSVSWNPYGNSHLLMTAGNDPIIKVFDLRYVGRNSSSSSSSSSNNSPAPLFEFRGHSAPLIRKFKTIIPPAFLSNSAIVAAGQGSKKLSLYSPVTGKTISRGELEIEPNAIAVNLSGGDISIAAASRNGDIYMLSGN